MEGEMDFTLSMKEDSTPALNATPTSGGAIPRSRYVLFVFVAAIGCAADLVTKAWCFSSENLRAGEIAWLWHGHVGIQLSRNLGALFGIGQGKFAYFAALAIIAAVAVPVWLFWFRGARNAWITISLGCIMGGILGNLYDRLGFSGDAWFGPGNTSPLARHAVRDWILWQVSDQWRWPNFNIADSLLVVGVAILLLYEFFNPEQPPASQNVASH